MSIPRGIPISDRAAEVLLFLTGAEGDDGPRKVIRQYLEAEERRTRSHHHGRHFAGFDAMLAPLADQLDALQSEVAGLCERAQATNLTDWAEFVATNPPSPAAIALMLVSHERQQRTAFTEGSAGAVSRRQSSVAKRKRPRAPESHASVLHRSVVVAAMQVARKNDQGFKSFMRSVSRGSVEDLSIREVLIDGEETWEIVIAETDAVQHRSWDGLRTWWTLAGKRC